MSKTKHSAALNDDEHDRLGAFLEQLPEAMNLEVMDGFFAALNCAPEMMPMGDVFAQVLGEEPQFADYEEAQEIMALLMRHWNEIARALSSDDFYFPILLEDEAGKAHANDWAQGFYLGMDFSRAGWDELLNDEEQGGWIIPILALVHEHDPDPEMRPGIIDDEQREKIIAGMVAGLKKIYGYFAPHRRAAAQAAVATIVRSGPKIGRNEPCPCGSGRKYKHCCGGKELSVH